MEHYLLELFTKWTISLYLLSTVYILQVVDMPIDHPSCSKQHAALQYRLVQVENEEGRNVKVVK